MIRRSWTPTASLQPTPSASTISESWLPIDSEPFRKGNCSAKTKLDFAYFFDILVCLLQYQSITLIAVSLRRHRSRADLGDFNTRLALRHAPGPAATCRYRQSRAARR